MEKVEAMSKAYQLIITALTNKFGKQGYVIAEEKESDGPLAAGIPSVQITGKC